MKIVLDSNILLVSIGKRSSFRPIWDAFIEGRYNLLVSEDILYEYEEILQRYAVKGASDLIVEILNESPHVNYQKVYYSWNLITQDPDDNKFFDVAVAGGADYLVTNDAHFDVVKNLKFPKVSIINADEFVSLAVQL